MPLTVANAENAYMQASQRFEEWKKHFEAQWQAPVADAFVARIWKQLPPEVHAELRRMNPEAYDKMVKMMEVTNGS